MELEVKKGEGRGGELGGAEGLKDAVGRRIKKKAIKVIFIY